MRSYTMGSWKTNCMKLRHQIMHTYSIQCGHFNNTSRKMVES